MPFDSACGLAGTGVRYVLVGSSILLMAPLMQAASRKTTNSKPSLEISVTYLLRVWPWAEAAIFGSWNLEECNVHKLRLPTYLTSKGPGGRERGRGPNATSRLGDVNSNSRVREHVRSWS